MMLHPTFQAKLPLMVKLFREHKIKSAYAFGSVISDEFNNESDFDLLINFEDGLEPLWRKENFGGIYMTL